MRRTYLDTGVLIEAAAGKGPKAGAAPAVPRDPTRAFLSCPFLELELLPQTILNRNRLQQRFLETYLSGTDGTEELAAIRKLAFRETTRSPVGGMDALHVVAAHSLRADAFITTQKPGKAIYRNSLVPVVFLSA
jgi:hypothetical protein